MESPLNPATVNDQQSKLNRTEVAHLATPQTLDEVRGALRLARRRNLPVAVCGGRHAMGGQQFSTGGVLLDLSALDAVHDLDPQRGLVTVEAGIFWPALMEELDRRQPDADRPWCIRQKQTGVDRVSLGGSLAANAHGRGLTLPPLVEDVEAFTLMDAAGHLHHCSRTENAERFALAIGGYGCFGLILDVTLRLVRRQTVQRRVQPIAVADPIPLAEQQLDAGALYGDCQYATHLQDPADQHALTPSA